MLLLDSGGKERVRLEGYLPNAEFVAALESGLGRLALVHKKYADADRWYGDVITRFPESHAAPEATYWKAVARYKGAKDHDALDNMAAELQKRYPKSVWASKASAWLPK